MTNIKGFAFVVVGILIFTGTCIFANDIYDSSRTQGTTDLEVRAKDLMDDIRGNERLLAPGSGPGGFDPQKVMNIDGKDLAAKDLEFQLEIVDVGGYDRSYTRSVTLGNPIQTSTPPAVLGKGEMVTILSAATMPIEPDEVHVARLVLRVWEADHEG